MEDYRQLNRANWNDRVAIHWDSEEYEVQRYVDDPSHISGIVEFDSHEVGPVAGKSLLHLQCHIGTDTISWARLGANVTGLDFSDASIDAASKLFDLAGSKGRFVVSDLYEAPEALPNEQFDVVYTGIGSIGWLPNIRRWADVVSHFVRPGGLFYIREGHPVTWSVTQDRDDDLLVIEDPYFEVDAPLVEENEKSYFGEGTLEHRRVHEWNHGIGETVTALIDAGLRIESLKEYQFTEWQALPVLRKSDDGRWRLVDRPERLPLSYSIRATKPES